MDVRRQMFVFTAARPEAQRDYSLTMAQPANIDVLRRNLGNARLDEIVSRSKGPVYAWGATPGERNIPTWERMRIGDYVIAYWGKRLRSISMILDKVHDAKLARDLWGIGTNPDNAGLTWEYVYFLDRLAEFSLPSPRRFWGHEGPLGGNTVQDIVNRIQNAS